MYNFQMISQKKSIFRTIFVIAITIVIFSIIFTKIDFYTVVDILSQTNLFYLSVSFMLLPVTILFVVKRWQFVLKIMGYSITFYKCFIIVMAARPLISIAPSRTGDYIKAYYLKDFIPASKTIGSVLTEQIFDVFTLVLFSLIGMIFCVKYSELAGIISIILLCIVVIFLFLHIDFHLPIKESWGDKLQNITISMKIITKDKKIFSGVLACSFSIWFSSIMQAVMLFYALEIQIPLLFIVANIPIAIFIGLIPITLGGMGTRDAAIIFLFLDFAMPSELLGVGILYSLVKYWTLSLLGIPFMRKMMKQT